jgi:hypothetical protein
MAGETCVTMVVPGHDRPLAAMSSSHPNFKDILALAVALSEGEGSDLTKDEVVALFDPAAAVAAKFERLTERIAVVGGEITLDGDVIDNSLTKQVLRHMEEGSDDWKPLVAFFEKVQANPDSYSREQLYSWVGAQSISITDEGDLVCYKGVQSDGNGGWQSKYTGTAIVDGETVEGHIPNAAGSLIEMPRSQVLNDPNTHCSRGLHVGSFAYAQGWASGAMLEVHVNPRDFVSVPLAEKARVCRYRVVDVIETPHTSPIVGSYSTRYEDDDEEYCEICGEHIDSLGLCECEDDDGTFDE